MKPLFILLLGIGCFPGCASNDLHSKNHETSPINDSAATTDSQGVPPETNLSGPAGDMVWVVMEPGRFWMGSPETEWGRLNDELQHEVTHVHRYAIAATEVTCAQWNALNSDSYNPCTPHQCNSPTDCILVCSMDDCPVARISLENAKNWMDALSVSAGLAPCYENGAQWETPFHCPGFRLPTESEWERAARGGTSGMTYNGDFVDPGGSADMPAALQPIAWCGRSGMGWKDGVPRPVAQGEPNPFGLYDVIGNVAEMVTWDARYYSGRPDSPYRDMDSGYLSWRGGSYHSYYLHFAPCRMAERYRVNASAQSGRANVGLRPVRTLPGGQLPRVQAVDWCPSPPATCHSVTEEEDRLLHRFSDDTTYTDIVGRHDTIAIAGYSESQGSFVEIATVAHSYVEYEFNAYFPEILDTSIRVTRIAFAANETETIIYSILCSDMSCSLYRLEQTIGEWRFAAVENGNIPDWIGEVRDFVVLHHPLEIIVAGSGIAVFNGMDWTTVISSAADEHYTAVHGYEYLSHRYYAAGGTHGLLRMALGDGEWERLETGMIETLTDIRLGRIHDQIIFQAIGENGTLILGPLHQFSSCRMGEMQFVSMIDDTGNYLMDDQSRLYTYLLEGTPPMSCRNTTAPAGSRMAVLICGIGSSRLSMMPNGLYGTRPFCADD